jgi:hypothetical protein
MPVRAGPFVAAMVSVTEPGPLPLAAEITIQGSLLDASHVQPAAVLMLTVRAPPLASAVCVSGDTSKLQPGAWFTVKTWPATVSVPVRAGPPVGATVKLTVPFPVPADVATETQSTSLAAVHGHPVPAVTVTTFEPPAAPTANVLGAIAYVHPSACVTLK